MFRNFLIILAVLMSVSLFAGDRVRTATGNGDQQTKFEACRIAKEVCKDKVKKHKGEYLKSYGKCSCVGPDYWRCNVDCKIGIPRK